MDHAHFVLYGRGTPAYRVVSPSPESAVVASPSFYSLAPERHEADDLFSSYLQFLEERNGSLFQEDGFERREAAMSALPGDEVVWSGRFDSAVFNRNYIKLQDDDLSAEQLALLAFVKMNAGEAYGVEVMQEARADLMARPEPAFVVERVLSREEEYHTRLLVGATRHVEGLEVTGAWRPAWPLKILILALAKAPPSFFHPIILGAEISGVFTVNWFLEKMKDLFPDDPLVRESMEERLVQVLIDEVGHVAFNRLCVGQRGLDAGRWLGGQVCNGHDQMTPELLRLGYGTARQRFADFDYAQLPEEVRRHAWFA